MDGRPQKGLKRGPGPRRKTALKPVSDKRAESGEPPLKRGSALRPVSPRKVAEQRTPPGGRTPPSPLARTTPLSRHRREGQAADNRPGKSPSRRPASTAKKPPRKNLPDQGEGFPAAVRRAMFERCRGLCERCGRPLGQVWHAHHRLRRRERDHTLDNGVALHPLCHVLTNYSVHGSPAEAKDRGLIVPPGQDPREARLVLATGEIVYLHPTDPRYLPAPAAA